MANFFRLIVALPWIILILITKVLKSGSFLLQCEMLMLGKCILLVVISRSAFNNLNYILLYNLEVLFVSLCIQAILKVTVLIFFTEYGDILLHKTYSQYYIFHSGNNNLNINCKYNRNRHRSFAFYDEIYICFLIYAVSHSS